jgi:hypothetical protein
MPVKTIIMLHERLRPLADDAPRQSAAEACFAHAVGNAVTRAYLRTTMLERRRTVMTDWAAMLADESEQANVIQFQTKRRCAPANCGLSIRRRS